MKLKQSEVNMIYDTLTSVQEYDFTMLFGFKLSQISDEIEKDYHRYQTSIQEAFKKYGVEKDGMLRLDLASKENQEKFQKENQEMLDSETEYNIDPIPFDLLMEQGKVPLKFQRNLKKIIAKK